MVGEIRFTPEGWKPASLLRETEVPTRNSQRTLCLGVPEALY